MSSRLSKDPAGILCPRKLIDSAGLSSFPGLRVKWMKAVLSAAKVTLLSSAYRSTNGRIVSWIFLVFSPVEGPVTQAVKSSTNPSAPPLLSIGLSTRSALYRM
ncbi:hypothetical protein LTR28_000680 [Elasticomyces elasticus]|nr:hypothetical protein LTR28_000680 [Elasticomyces elasticus]